MPLCKGHFPMHSGIFTSGRGQPLQNDLSHCVLYCLYVWVVQIFQGHSHNMSCRYSRISTTMGAGTTGLCSLVWEVGGVSIATFSSRHPTSHTTMEWTGDGTQYFAIKTMSERFQYSTVPTVCRQPIFILCHTAKCIVELAAIVE